MLAGFPGLRSLVLLFSESFQLSVPVLLHVPVSQAAADSACSMAGPFPAAAAWAVVPVPQGCPGLAAQTH